MDSMAPIVAGMTSGWKLFQEEFTDNGSQPRSLVHGFPADGRTGIKLPGERRTTVYPLGQLIAKEDLTKGFNFFQTREEALEYLPRFKVRGYRLQLVRIHHYPHDVVTVPNSAYSLLHGMLILPECWNARKSGKELLPHVFS